MELGFCWVFFPLFMSQGFTEHFLCAKNGDRQWELERSDGDRILK